MTETTTAPPHDIPAAVEFQEASDGIECYCLTENDLRVLLLPQDGAPVWPVRSSRLPTW
jgi:zinc protease